jgi:hypothetical protein
VTVGHEDATELPLRFTEALDAIKGAIGGCETARIPTDTILAALMAELMKRLVGAYGPRRVISVLTDLATHIAIDDPTRH